MIEQGVNAAGQPYRLTTGFWEGEWQAVRLFLGLEGRAATGLTPNAYWGAGRLGTLGGVANAAGTLK